jgi:hypothetical protein
MAGLTMIERVHLGKVLGYDTSECTSRTRNAVVKWIVETYSDVNKSELLKKLPLVTKRIPGSTDLCNWLISISDISDVLEKEFGSGDDTWDPSWHEGENSKWLYEWYFDVNGTKFSVYKLWDSEDCLEVGIENMKKKDKDIVMRQIEEWVAKKNHLNPHLEIELEDDLEIELEDDLEIELEEEEEEDLEIEQEPEPEPEQESEPEPEQESEPEQEEIQENECGEESEIEIELDDDIGDLEFE